MSESTAQLHTYKVQMKCNSCVKTLEKVLDMLKGKGIEEYTIKLDEQKVEVKSTLTVEEVMAAIKSTGKEVSIISSQ